MIYLLIYKISYDILGYFEELRNELDNLEDKFHGI